MKKWVIWHTARLNHASWRAAKVAHGRNGHVVNGRPFDLNHEFHQLHVEHQNFELAIARNQWRTLFSRWFWFG